MSTHERLGEIASAALAHAAADDAEATVVARASGLTRFAKNVVHQNVVEDLLEVSLRVRFGRREGRATTNQADPASLAALFRRASEIARGMPERDDELPFVAPSPVAPIPADDVAATAAAGPGERAAALRESLARLGESGKDAAGYFATARTATALFNTRGVERFHAKTEAQFSATVFSNGASGWSRGADRDIGRVDAAALLRHAEGKADAARNPRETPPGDYTVVLEPAAVDDLIWFLLAGFNARSVLDRQSFLTGKVGEAMFPTSLTWTDDVRDARQSGEPFDGEGAPRSPLVLVDRGRIAALVADRRSAAALGVPATGHALPEPNPMGAIPRNLVWEGEGKSLDELVAGTTRGILVTRFWYNRLVEPMTVTVTGTTRDGTYWIEDGAVRHPIMNLRFNQSLVEFLRNVVATGRSERGGASDHAIGAAVVPAVRARAFRFTAVAPA